VVTGAGRDRDISVAGVVVVVSCCCIVGSDIVPLDEVGGATVESRVQVVTVDAQTSPGQVRVTGIQDLRVDESPVCRIDHLGTSAQASLTAVESSAVGIGAAHPESRAGA